MCLSTWKADYLHDVNGAVLIAWQRCSFIYFECQKEASQPYTDFSVYIISLRLCYLVVYTHLYACLDFSIY